MSPEEADQRTEPVSGNSTQPFGKTPPTKLVLHGVLSLLICHPMGIIVWIAGNRYIKKCRQLGVVPDPLAVTGRMLGKISTIFAIVVIGLIVGALVFMELFLKLAGEK